MKHSLWNKLPEDTNLDQNELVKRLFEFLDYKEESDSGTVFNPIALSCCRAMMLEPCGEVLKKLKDSIVS